MKKSIQINRWIGIVLIVLAVFYSKTVAGRQLSEMWGKPPTQKPVQIDINIQINKIYEINSLDETYQIDGYLVAGWKYASGPEKKLLFENEVVDDLIGKGIWIPAFEFINVVENRHIANKQVIIDTAGQVIYNERFNATFSLPMNFKLFPFDRQDFSIQLETFSYDKNQIVFTTSSGEKNQVNEQMSDQWRVDENQIFVEDVVYTHLGPDPVDFSRYNFIVSASRKVNRYIWQLILPLILIISISWAIFWIKTISDQLSTGFTLMLTLVAFNFNTSSILPSLPYMTLIELLTTMGYISVFIVLVIVIGGNALIVTRSEERYKRFIKNCRYFFPITFLCLLVVICWVFLSVL